MAPAESPAPRSEGLTFFTVFSVFVPILGEPRVGTALLLEASDEVPERGRLVHVCDGRHVADVLMIYVFDLRCVQ